MDTKKLEQWSKLLLDTGKRNYLISFKDTKASTVEVVVPSTHELFEKVESSAVFEVFDPKIKDDEEEDYRDRTSEDGEETDTKPAKLNREEYIAQYGPKVKKANQVLIYNANVNPVNALKHIDKVASSHIEETGNNVAYMAFGFIHWRESENSNHIFKAPILLAPITFSNESFVSPWYIHMTEDDVIVNPTFNFKMQNEFNVSLPEYNDEPFTEYIVKAADTVKKLGWTVTDECKIGIFSFLKMNMYLDLKNNKDAILENENVRLLLGEARQGDKAFAGGQEYHLNNPLLELHNVVDADSSQIEAIEMAKAGVSYVLQGPPGTGKSQTITNIIAECLSDGKKVLFVSEKQAALNVVYDKLKKAGLDEFCLELHSYKANKKDAIDNLNQTLRAGRTKVSQVAETALEEKQKSQKELDSYEVELHKNRDVINRSLYGLYNDFSACRKAKEVKVSISSIQTKGDDYLKGTSNLLSQYEEFVPSIGYQYKRNPWYGYINLDTSYQNFEDIKNAVAAMVDVFSECAQLRTDIFNKYGIDANSINALYDDGQILKALADSDVITAAFCKKDHCSYLKEQLQKLKALSKQIIAEKEYIDASYDADLYKVDASNYHKQLTRTLTSFFSRAFSADYKKIVSDIRLNSKTGKKPSYAEAIELMEKLSAYQAQQAEFTEIENNIKSSLGSGYNGVASDWAKIMTDVDVLAAAIDKVGDLTVINGMDANAYQSCREDFREKSRRIIEIIDGSKAQRKLLARSFDKAIYDINESSIDDSINKMKGCQTDSDKLENWYRFYNLLLQMDKMELIPYVDAAIEANIPAEDIVLAYKRNFFRQWIDYVIHTSDVLMAFNRISHDKQVESFERQDRTQFEISKAQIRSTLAANRPSLDLVSAGSALATLLREGEKKRRQKSVRSLLSEAGELIQQIKPCFLMSPLSVSTFLTTDSIRFDVVVFDEASQIFPQDAIGAIYRGKQLIVVGDSKQMPPSNFFSSAVEIDDDDEEAGDVTDFESILDLCSTSMSQLRLNWHYRSRFEELIAFSNKNFYNNSLISFPSAITNKKGVGVDYYHVEGGLFDRKSRNNRKEAEFIVDLIFKHIEEYPNRSLGVVAFSVSQQDMIDRLLSKRRQADPSKEAFFKKDVPEPFFIKNLETVQGDERDTIIFSVGYARDSAGNFHHFFGPLSKAGGERRLNVAVTRAKINVQLVASIHYLDIDLGRTSSEGARLLREYLDYAENGHIALERAIDVKPFEHFDSEFELEVCEYLKSNGFEVDTQVGVSGFKIDLGLKRPGTSDYVLAIECDGATYHSSRNARDRDRLRQEILESMGWRFYRIWSTDWFRNTAVEKERLLEACKKAVTSEQTNDICDSNSVTDDVEDDGEVSENIFEETAKERHLAFPTYQMADELMLASRYTSMQVLVKEILEVEAPLSEDWLLKRIAWMFGREKVTSVVQREFDDRMYGCENNGIIRRNGFLFLEDQQSFVMRVPAANDKKTRRDIKYIAPEEIAAGMYVIIKHNVSVDKDGLFKTVANELGFQRVAENITAKFEAALYLLRNFVQESDNVIMLKQRL